jgi:hypothetical protein
MQNYRAVNARANDVASTGFQPYSNDQNAFVAPLSSTQQAGISNVNASQNIAQPYFQNATTGLLGAQQSALPYYDQATQSLLGGQEAGVTGTQAAYQPMQQGAQAAQGLQGDALTQYRGALQSSQPYNQAAGQYAQTGLAAATPYYEQAAQNVTGAQGAGGVLNNAALNSLQQAGQAAQPLQNDAAGNINSAASAAQPYNQAATAGIMGGLAGSQPFNAAAAQGFNQAQAGAQPYQGMATGLAAAGTQAVNAGPLGGEQINQYMSPYLNSVVGSTMANLRQQQGQEQSSLLGNQISQGAFGGDRGRIAQANLARQQDLATGQTVSGLMNQGYGQALSTAQQQQQLGLGAGQANRAALQQGASQMLGIGQQGYSQGMGAASAQQGLGQQIYGQGLGAGQAMAGIGQQQYGQQLGTGQAQAALGQQLYGQGANTAQQQAALGQQQYSQGMGAASAQQGLGQGLYGMGTGMGSFMQGLGQQNYAQQSNTGQNLAQLGQQQFGQGAAQTAQQAALAQQQYGMGAGTAGQLAGLGQGVYGMGAGTSQALAGLGTQAQQNALGAAQAQIGAGTLQQQTQQAGQTALYNQYLQQQGFPYQQAQFLANIAMGTGALSGSTTQTTQPASFFSDRRLKEAAEPIGKTFDGQDIYKYRYKNEPGTRIGLMAQDVEKHHPDAVGLAGGYKTVDYDKATEAAARKGHYASGGLIPQSEGGAVMPFRAGQGYADGGSPSIVSPRDLEAIQQALSAQLAMYGGAGLNINGTPGATGVVPAATLATPSLVTAGDLPRQEASDFSKAADTGEKIAGLYKSGKEFWKDVKPEDSASTGTTSLTNDNPDYWYRGGLVGHYAMGGMPGKEGYIPEDIYKPEDEKKKVETPNIPHAGQGTNIVDVAKTAAEVAALFAARGGRIGKDDGGPLIGGMNEPDELTKAWQRSHERENANTPATMMAYNPPVRNTGSLESDTSVQTAPIQRSPGLAMLMQAQSPQPAAQVNRPAARPAAQVAKRTSPGVAPPLSAPINVSARPPIRSEKTGAGMAPGLGGGNAPAPISNNMAAPPAYQKGLAPEATQAAASLAPAGIVPPPKITDETPPRPGFLERAERTLAPKGGYLDRLSQMKEDAIIPLLTGLGAMAGSSNRYGLGALMEGVGAGAAAYQPTKIGQAKVSQAGSEATGAALDTMKKSVTTINGIPYFLTSDGKMLNATQWRHMGFPKLMGGDTAIAVANRQLEKEGGQPSPAPQAETSNAPPPPKQGIDQDIYNAAETEVQRMESLTKEARDLQTSANTKLMMDARDARDNAVVFGDTLNEGAKAFFPQFKSGVLTPGAGQTGRAAAVNVWNTLMRGLGYGANATLEQGLEEQQVAEKTTAVLAGLRTAGLGQTALASLQTVAAGIPNGKMNQGAVARVMSDMYVQNQRSIDYAQFLENYASSHPDAPYIIGQGAQTLFNKKYNAQYETDKANLEEIFSLHEPKTGEALVEYLFGRGKDKALQARRTPEAFEKTYGKGITRYITRIGQ